MTRITAIVFALGTTLGTAATAQPPPGAPGLDAFRPIDFNIPQWAKASFLRLEPIQQELRMTPAQKREASAPRQIMQRFQERRQAIFEIKDQEKQMAARQALLREMDDAQIETLKPEQRERLAQIQIQAQGLLAFLLPEFHKQLGLSGDQVEKIKPIVEAGQAKTMKTSAVPLPIGLKIEDKAGNLEALRKQIDTPEFHEATEKRAETLALPWKRQSSASNRN